jgi:hypothetical protein
VLEYATGRPSEDGELVEQLERRFAADGYRLRNLVAAIASLPQSYELPREDLKAGATIVRNRACSLPSCEPSHPGEPRITVAGVNAAGGIPEGRNAASNSTALASS